MTTRRTACRDADARAPSMESRQLLPFRRDVITEICPDGKRRQFEIVLPNSSLTLQEDAEWCLVRHLGSWEHLRFQDSARIYRIPGLYEQLFCEGLQCRSASVACQGLMAQVATAGDMPSALRVLDVGAGIGLMGEELRRTGVQVLTGVDVLQEAAEAAQRDRPGVYTAYHVLNLADVSETQRQQLLAQKFNCLTCITIVGLSISPTVFQVGLNLIEDGGWVVFNIKETSWQNPERSGLAQFLQKLVSTGHLSVRLQKRYAHRLSTSGKPICYLLLVTRKSVDQS